eukprot:scaffold22396_cov56-Phaeocystis_antarctica.AAC.3
MHSEARARGALAQQDRLAERLVQHHHVGGEAQVGRIVVLCRQRRSGGGTLIYAIVRRAANVDALLELAGCHPPHPAGSQRGEGLRRVRQQRGVREGGFDGRWHAAPHQLCRLDHLRLDRLHHAGQWHLAPLGAVALYGGLVALLAYLSWQGGKAFFGGAFARICSKNSGFHSRSEATSPRVYHLQVARPRPPPRGAHTDRPARTGGPAGRLFKCRGVGTTSVLSAVFRGVPSFGTQSRQLRGWASRG